MREFTDEHVSDDVLRELIDAAIQAPSAINQQPWCFVVIVGHPRRQSAPVPHKVPNIRWLE